LSGNIVARRYARALFGLGVKKGDSQIDGYGKDLAQLQEVFAATPEASAVFRNPIFSAEDKKAVIGKIMDKLKITGEVRNFCLLLADKGRLNELPAISSVYAELLDEAQGIKRGVFVSAVKIAEKKKGEIVKQLEDQLKAKLVLDFEVDPDILGGVVLKVGDQVLDASLKAQLSILKETIRRGE
jgi:F-type H+-transporting ATPase subunit delta